MGEPIAFLGLILVGYLLGSIPFAYIAGRLLKGIDLRRYGSGSVSGSNVAAAVAPWTILPVGVADVAKAAAAVLLARELNASLATQALVGLAAVAGHNWSLYLGFSGGRGISTIIGVLAVLGFRELVAFVLVSLLVLAITRNGPISSGLAIALLPVWSWVLGEPPEVIWLTAGLFGLMVLKRLVSNPGTEAQGVSLRSILLHRLLLDRDIPDREAWVKRRLPETAPPGQSRGQ